MNTPMRSVAVGITALFSCVLLWTATLSSHIPVTTNVRFNEDLVPILDAKCAGCHIEGGIAMPLRTWAEVRPWAVAIKEEILNRQMPPWPAERGYGSFANDITLTPREIEFITSWVDGGVPAGETPPPAFIDHGAHWMLGPPDDVLTVSHAPVPASDASDASTRWIVDPGFTRDTWVRGFDFKPGDKSAAVAFLTVLSTGQYLGGWTPWSSSVRLPEGVAFKIPARSRIAIDVSHGPGPRHEDARPQIGLYKSSPSAVPITDIVMRASVSRGASLVRSERALLSPHTLTGMRVDMKGGRSIELRAQRPDGSFEPLLRTRSLPPGWQPPYVLREPISLPAGSVLQAIAYFDPSEAVPALQVTFNAYPEGEGRQP